MYIMISLQELFQHTHFKIFYVFCHQFKYTNPTKRETFPTKTNTICKIPVPVLIETEIEKNDFWNAPSLSFKITVSSETLKYTHNYQLLIYYYTNLELFNTRTSSLHTRLYTMLKQLSTTTDCSLHYTYSPCFAQYFLESGKTPLNLASSCL